MFTRNLPTVAGPLHNAQIKNAQIKNAQIICDGNSITQSIYGPKTSYPQQLEDLLNRSGYGVSVLNIGVSGQATAHMLNDAARQIDRYYDPTRPNLLIAKEGGNHIYYGATVQAAYETFAAYCAARRNAGFKVIAIDTFPRKNGYFPGSDRIDVYASELLAYNQLIRLNWRNFADLYFDARLLLPEFDMRPPYMDDGVHPSIAGNARLAAVMAEFLVRNLRG